MPDTLTPVTIGQVLEEAARRLQATGIPDPREEAAALWAGLHAMTLGDVWLSRGSAAPGGAREAFARAAERRAQGEPLPYVVGLAGFRTLELAVDPRVPIPRPETEGLVERVLAWAATRAAGSDRAWGTAVDVGTGSGCIALSLAVEGKFSLVLGTDVSPEALEVAWENLQRVTPAIPVELRCGSLFEPLGGDKFDVVVANPPYVTAAEFEQLDLSVRGFEPRAALVSRENGLAHTSRLFERAHRHLVAGGLLALEVDCTRAKTALAMAHQTGWADARLEPDLFGRPRYILATREVGK